MTGRAQPQGTRNVTVRRLQRLAMDDVTLILGDAIMRTGPANQSVDWILTDPPYLEGDFSWMLELLRVGKRLVLDPGKLESFNWIRRQNAGVGVCLGAIHKSLGGRA